jgi:zinc protease
MKILQALLALTLVALGTSAARASIADSAVRKDIGGIDVVVLATGAKDVVTLAGTLPAGDDRSPASSIALATLTGAMLDKGTMTRDKFAISKALGDVGATISFSVGASALQIGGKCLRKDLALLMSLVAEQLRTPALSETEFAKLKKQLAGAIRQQLDDTEFRADDTFTRAVYPSGHPNRQSPPDDVLKAIESATLDDVKKFHAQYYGPTGMRLVLVGDVDPRAAQATIAKAFAGWKGGTPAPAVAKAGRVDAAKVQTVYMADKANVSVIWGQATQLRYADPDTLALRVGTNIFGSGFTGRLMANVRDKEGLTYGIGSYVGNDTYVDGDWRIEASFAPAMLDKGIASTQRQLTSWYGDGVTSAELARAKTKIAGSYKVGLATTGGLAGTLLATLNRGLPLSFVDDYPRRIDALTLDEVNGAIKRHLDPAQMVIVKAGTLAGATASPK